MIVNWKEDILKEKSLQEVYLASRKLPKSPFNRAIYAVVLLAIISISMIWIRNAAVTTSAKVTLEVAKIGFDLTVQILGFLIGGFAIFATVSDPRLMTRLSQARMSNSNLSVFKAIFFNFLSVFYVYIVTLTACLIVQICADLNVVQIDEIIDRRWVSSVLTVVNSLAFSILAFLTSMAIVRLKSFIWNVYQAFITFLAVSEIMESEDPRGRSAGDDSSAGPA